MSFAAPTLLIGLLLIPLALLAYVGVQRRRRRDAAAWANPALAPGLVTGSPGGKRHVPALLVLLAITALVVALARPQHTVAAPERAANVMMVTDISGSMNATDVQPDRLTAAKRAARSLADKLPEEFRLGLISFSDYAEQRAALTTDRDQVNAAIEQLTADGGTAMGDGLERGLQSVRAPVPNADGSGTRRLPSIIVLLSDGKQNAGRAQPLDVARQAKAVGVPIYTIALGTPSGQVRLRDQFGFAQQVSVPPDIATLREIARVSGGRAFTASDADRLESIYANLGTRLSAEPVERELTSAFAAFAVVALLAAAALSLRWFGRLI